MGCVIYEMASLKPPFRAEDMEGLYKKVVAGAYQKLPGHFSVDLNEIISFMLKVNPKSRLSTNELLSTPVIVDKIRGGVVLKENSEDVRLTLLQTIKFPNNIQYLTDKLPRSNYEPLLLQNKTDYASAVDPVRVNSSMKERSQMGSASMNRQTNNKSQIHEMSQIHDSSQILPELNQRNLRKSPVRAANKHSAQGMQLDRKLEKQHERIEQVLEPYPSKSRNTMKYC